MKKLFFFCAAMCTFAFSQSQVNTYNTTGTDLKLTGVMLDDSLNPTQIPRFSLWFNFSEYFHFDVAESFGFFVGIGVENIGYIAQYNDSLNTKVKYRSYLATMPIGFKFGNFDKNNPTFFFAGAAVSVPFHFKEKIFYNDKKDLVFKEWFSSRTNFFQPSAFVGITFPNQMSLKVQYYFENFMNGGFTDNANGIDIKPYSHIVQSNIIALTLGGSFTGVRKKK